MEEMSKTKGGEGKQMIDKICNHRDGSGRSSEQKEIKKRPKENQKKSKLKRKQTKDQDQAENIRATIPFRPLLDGDNSPAPASCCCDGGGDITRAELRL